jgi:hypothetical protein
LELKKTMDFKKSPCDFTKEEITGEINGQFPDLTISNLEILHQVHSLVVEVNGEIVFKFPWHPKSNLESELNVLSVVAAVTKTSIPVPSHVDPTKRFFGYTKLPGEVLKDSNFKKMSTEAKRSISRSCARFLYDLHRGVSLESVKGLDIKTHGSQFFLDIVYKHAEEGFRDLPDIQKYCDELLKKYENEYSSEKIEEVYLYNDLHTGNLVISNSKELSGIIDFGFTGIGECEREFCHMYKSHPDVFEMLAADYEEISGKTLNRKRIDLMSKVGVLGYLAEISVNRKDLVKAREKRIVTVRKWIADA